MKYAYTARDAQGGHAHGIIEGENANTVAGKLAQQGLIPLTISQDMAGSDSPKPARAKNRGRTPLLLDVMLFSQQMAAMLRAGVPILRALAASESGEENPMGPVAHAIRMDLQAGKPLSVAMGAHPSCFDDYYLAMVKIGEATGSIETIFQKLHAHMDFQKQMREQVKTALRYPMIVIGVVFLALMVVNVFVIPVFAKVYLGFKAELPFFTKLLINTSSVITKFWMVFLGAGFGSVYAFKSWTATTAGRLAWDRMKLKIPIAGNIVHRATLARFSQSLSLAISAGLPIASAMELVGDTTDNAWLAKQISTIKSQLERGESLYRSCLASNIFTPITLQMILVGEESGNLDTMLSQVAKLYQEQVAYDLKTLSAQLEPFLLLFLGGLVLILALGIFLPIWNLSSAAFSGTPK